MSSPLLSALRPLTSAALTSGDREKLQSLLQSPQDALFFHQVLVWGRDLKNRHEDSIAAQVFQVLDQEGVPLPTRSEAHQEWEAMNGRGTFGWCAEYRLSRLLHDTAQYRTIFPMLLGTAFAGLARSAVLARPGWVGSKWAAEGLAFATELPVFVGAQRALLGLEGVANPKEVLDDFAQAGIALGILRLAGMAGHGSARWMPSAVSSMTRSQVSKVLFPQAAAFLGLWTAQRIQNEQVTALDTVASMLALSVGAHLGRKLTGDPLLGLGREVALRRPPQPFSAPFLRSWGEVRRPAFAADFPANRSLRPAEPLSPSTFLIKGQGSPESKNFEESLSIERLAYHTEMGGKPFTQELTRRAATDPKAQQALQEALRRYHQRNIPARWLPETTVSQQSAEPPRRMLNVGRHFYQIIREENGRRWKLLLGWVSGNTARGEKIPRTIRISASPDAVLSLEKLSTTLRAMLKDYPGSDSEVFRKGVRVDFSETPADYLQAKLRPQLKPFPLEPSLVKQELRRSFPPGKFGARLFDWVEKAKRDLRYAGRLISRAQRNHPFFREAVTKVDLSHYEGMARVDMEYLDLITRFAICHHPGAIPALGRLAPDIPLAAYELQFLVEEGRKGALGALGQAAYYQPVAKKLLQELSERPEYRKPIRRALKSGKYDRLLNL